MGKPSKAYKFNWDIVEVWQNGQKRNEKECYLLKRGGKLNWYKWLGVGTGKGFIQVLIPQLKSWKLVAVLMW